MNVKTVELKTFVSGLAIVNSLHLDFIYAVNNAFKLDCIKHG